MWPSCKSAAASLLIGQPLFTGHNAAQCCLRSYSGDRCASAFSLSSSQCCGTCTSAGYYTSIWPDERERGTAQKFGSRIINLIRLISWRGERRHQCLFNAHSSLSLSHTLIHTHTQSLTHPYTLLMKSAAVKDSPSRKIVSSIFNLDFSIVIWLTLPLPGMK